MRFVKTIKNDIVDCDKGIAVSVWYYYCPHHCKGCHNSDYWSEDCLTETPDEKVIQQVIKEIGENGIKRNLSILGGEPLEPYNSVSCLKLIKEVKKNYPDILIYIWTGYTLEELKNRRDNTINQILENIDVLIDGRFLLGQRDITLKLRGSPNQRILYKNKDF